jgi:anti-anti-sigma regulatory factor
MLRITLKRTRKALTFRLEGKLAGPWSREFEDCWNTNIASQRKPIIRVDLTGVTFIDKAGKACLAAMHRQGAQFIAPDCLTKDVVREICEDCSRTAASEMTA